AAPRRLCLDDPLALLDESARERYVTLLHKLRGAGVAVLISGRNPQALDSSPSRIVTLESGRISRAVQRRRTLELEVGMPSYAATALANRIPSVRRLGHALRIALDEVTAEEVLSACLALGIRVHGSRVITTAAPGGGAEAGGGGDEQWRPAQYRRNFHSCPTSSSTTRSRARPNRSLPRTAAPCGCTRAVPRSTTRRISATSARSSSRTYCGAC